MENNLYGQKKVVPSIIFLLSCLFVETSTAQVEDSWIIPREIHITGKQQTVETYNGTSFNKFIVYYDGLGREVQTHAIEATPLNGTVISFTEYDRMGHNDSISYLPYVTMNMATDRIAHPKKEQFDFYSKNLKYNKDAKYAFSRKIYEDSPLDRVIATNSPGLYYSDNAKSGHPVTHNIRLNNFLAGKCPLDPISKYILQDDSLLVFNGYYPSSQLVAKETISYFTDSIRIIKVEYINQQGQTIAKGERTDVMSKLTYYVYDDYGNLRYIIPEVQDQKIKQSLKNCYTPQELLFAIYYGYDKNGDKIEVHNPDQAPIYYVYDSRHRVILSQDWNQRYKHQWIFSEYDEYDRVLRNSIVYNDKDVSTLRALFDDCYGTAANEIVSKEFSGKRLLSEVQYTGYCEPRISTNVYPNVDMVDNENYKLPEDTTLPSGSGQTTIPPSIYNKFKIPEYLKYRGFRRRTLT